MGLNRPRVKLYFAAHTDGSRGTVVPTKPVAGWFQCSSSSTEHSTSSTVLVPP
jgi:hypothetical protein